VNAHPQTRSAHDGKPSEEFLAWLRLHDIEPNDCFEVCVADGMVLAHCYARNGEGNKFVLGSEAAKADPIVCELKEPMPA
jgi:hypothetical protein